MTDTEELIKAALIKQSERAPHAGPILHALSQPRRRSWRSLVVIVVAMLVTGGIAVPIALQSSPDAPSPAPEPEDITVGVHSPFAPTYLPEGFVEVGRSVIEGTASGAHTRTWRKPGTGPVEQVHLLMLPPGSAGVCTDPPPPPDVPQATGRPQLPQPSQRPQVPDAQPRLGFDRWMVDGWCLELMTGDLPAEVVQRVKESVRRDELTVTRAPVKFGPLPSFLTGKRLSIDEAGVIDVDVRSPYAVNPGFRVTIGPKALVTQREVGENIAHMTTDKDLGDGRAMRVQFSIGPNEFTQQQRDQILRDIQVVPVDYSWLGK